MNQRNEQIGGETDMSRKSTRGVYRERSDYTKLLAELQKQTTAGPWEKEAPVKGSEAKSPPVSSFRHRLMSDERICYLYAKGGNEIHDKTCPEARNINDSDLCSSGTYLSNMRQCPCCQTKAYLRLGARDFSRFSAYKEIFEQMGISPRLQRRMYVHDGIRTEYLGPGRLKLLGSEDTWILEVISGTGHLRLLHNNYRPLEDGTRQFVPGYHEQLICVSAQYAISVIAGYTYAAHKAAAERRQNMDSSVAEIVETPITPSRPLNLWERFKRWLKRRIQKGIGRLTLWKEFTRKH